MSICNKIFSPSGIISFRYSKIMLLFLDKTFFYYFSICQQIKYIDFNEMKAIFQGIAR